MSATSDGRKPVVKIDEATRRFCGDSGDGMEVDGKPLADTSAVFGHGGAWVSEFYDGFRGDLMEVCHLEPHVALTYTKAQRDELLSIGAGAVDGWERDRTEKLVTLMMG